MSGWKELTSETVLNALPTDMGNLYRSWVDANPTKVNRLAEIVSETVTMFREAVAVYPWYVMDPDITMVPVSGFRHALDMVIFNLGMGHLDGANSRDRTDDLRITNAPLFNKTLAFLKRRFLFVVDTLHFPCIIDATKGN